MQLLSENQIFEIVRNCLSETVYVSDMNKKSKKATLTYAKGMNYSPGNKIAYDKLKTDKMDVNNSDTYIVPLKGGIDSYNITSISGTEVMHYFKRYFENKKTIVKKDGNEYELEMLTNEFNDFLRQFTSKVGVVINYYAKQFENDKNFDLSKLSIYPVPSSSNFNVEMAKRMAEGSYLGLPTQVISDSLFVKDLRNLEKDTEFIERNKEFYGGKLSDEKNSLSVEDSLDDTISRANAIKNGAAYVDKINACADKLLNTYYRYNLAVKRGENVEKISALLASSLKDYIDTQDIAFNSARYSSNRNSGGDTGVFKKNIMQKLDYSKEASIKKRTKEIINIVKPLLKGETSPITNKEYINRFANLEIAKYEPSKFEIKSLPNSERLGMRNIYNPNKDEDIVKEELAKIKGTVFVIFDDNVSGGATLSDICYQAKKLGIEYIIPITFGKMTEKNHSRGVTYATPDGGYNL